LLTLFLAGTSQMATAYQEDTEQAKLQKSEKVDTKKTEEKKPIPVEVTIDFNVLPKRTTVNFDRLVNGNVNVGTGNNSTWEQNVSYDHFISGSFNIIAQDSVFSIGGERLSLEDNYNKTLRLYREYNLYAETSIWNLLIGVEGFISKEDVPNVIKGLVINSDFDRLAHDGRLWLGYQAGSFNGNFLAARYGRGQARTEGNQVFSGVSGGDGSLPLYIEDFEIELASLEGRLKKFLTNFTSASLKIERNWYQRVTYSPDPSAFGKNNFKDIRAWLDFEIRPVPNHDNVVIIVRFNEFYGDKDRLMFRNDPPRTQLFLRFVF